MTAAAPQASSSAHTHTCRGFDPIRWRLLQHHAQPNDASKLTAARTHMHTHIDLHTPLSTTLLLMFAPQHMHKHTHGDTVHSRTQHKQTPQHTPGNTRAHPTLHTCTHLSDTQCTLCLTYSGAHFAGAVKQQISCRHLHMTWKQPTLLEQYLHTHR